MTVRRIVRPSPRMTFVQRERERRRIRDRPSYVAAAAMYAFCAVVTTPFAVIVATADTSSVTCFSDAECASFAYQYATVTVCAVAASVASICATLFCLNQLRP